MSRTRLERFVRATLIAVALAFSEEARAQNTAQPARQAASAEIGTAPVRIDHRVLFRVRGTSSFPADTRAAEIEARILRLAENRSVSPEEIVSASAPLGIEIRGGGETIVTVLPVDAAMELMRPEELAAGHVQGIRSAIADYRASRTPERLRRGALLSALATLALLAAGFITSRILARLSPLLETRVSDQLADVSAADEPSGRRGQVAELFASVFRSVRWITVLALVYVWAQFVLGLFPWTSWLSRDLLGLLLNPLAEIATGVVDYVPKFLFLVTLTILTRYGLRLLQLYFTSVEQGSITLAKFEPDWAIPAYKVVRTFVIGLALVAAYPYLPGAGSEALQGLSVLGGLMLSLGASGAVSNVIAGYVHIFGRVFRLGDVIQVGDVRGEVTQVRLLTTRIRTPKNEEVTLPNSLILNTNLMNYSALARTRGLILHTEVGIGYDVPWRQVHAMLEEAARRTPDILTDPPPFILQRQLADFSVSYQLNVYSRTASLMINVISKLNQNILDVFNESGVQIMVPAYEGDPAEPKVVPREAWFAAPAKPPEEQA